MNPRPHNAEVERATLGACLIDGTAIDVVQTTLSGPEAFYVPTHRRIWQALTSLAAEHRPTDTISVCDALGDDLDKLGGAVVVASLASDTATSASAGYHAEIVQAFYVRRCVIDRSEQLQVLAADQNEPVESILSSVKALGEDLVTGRYDVWVSAGDAADEAMAEAERRAQNGGPLGISTSLLDVDRLVSGFRGGDLILLAGRPSMGKTALGLWLAREASRQVPVGIISAEMTHQALALRFVAMEANIDSLVLQGGLLEPDQLQAEQSAREVLRKRPIKIGDRLTRMSQIPGEVRRLHRQSGLGLVIVDYLQLLTPAKKNNSREREVAQMSADLKGLAVDLNIPMVVLSQLNRALNQRPDKRPVLSDLRESGSLEQDADLVLFVHRPAYYGQKVDKDNNDISDQCELIVAKHRNGPVGRALLDYKRHTGRFSQWQPEDVPDWVTR